MRHCVILGGGYVGSALAASLDPIEYSSTITTTTPSKVPSLASLGARVAVVHGDRYSEVFSAIDGCDILILSLAAGRLGDYRATYLDTARNVEQAVRDGARVGAIIYTGSASVYGNHEGVVTEQSELRGQTENQGLLIQTENILRGLESRERPVCIFRLGEIYGPGRDIATRLKALQGTQLRGDGQNLTNLIHRDDCVGALAYAMRHGLRGTYNLCGETHVTRQQLYDRICDAAQLGRLGWDGSASSQHGGRRQLSTHALQEKGYKFRHKFFEREGLVIE